MSLKIYLKEKLWPFLAGMGSAAIMVLAFFIPSLQDQYDRYQSRKIINKYELLGNDFSDEERYDMAEQAYQKAFELSDSKRLDLEIKRLEAKINRINMNPQWGAAPPEGLEEIDFQYVLHLQKEAGDSKKRVAALNSYGIFLVDSKKVKEAETAFKEAMALDSSDVLAYVNLGNLYDQQGKKIQAMQYYLKAITRDNDNGRAHYNLGLLYVEQGKAEEAKKEFSEAIRADSSDADAKAQYEMLIKPSDH
ncbi:MAG TPA: tetratricopeptide repeat protein [Chitinophagaceae bacterium]|nr:tetratricopeptide repeat protein [Chitinophagaceae bacterium]